MILSIPIYKEGKFQSANIFSVRLRLPGRRRRCPVRVQLPVRLRLVREKTKIECFLGFSMQNLLLPSPSAIASLVRKDCRPLVEKKKKIEFFLRFPIQNLLYSISLIRLKINEYVIIHRKI